MIISELKVGYKLGEIINRCKSIIPFVRQVIDLTDSFKAISPVR
jgi:hypothetical protein